MATLWDNVNALWRRKKPDTTPVTPDPDKPAAAVPWVRVGILLKSIPFEKLLPVFISVPTIVFLTISGFIAWVVLLLKFTVGLFNIW